MCFVVGGVHPPRHPNNLITRRKDVRHFCWFFFAVFHGWTRKRLSLSRSSLARHNMKPAQPGGTLDEDSFSQRSSPESRVHNSTPIVPPSVTSLSRVDFGPWTKYTPPFRIYISNALFPLSPHTPLHSRAECDINRTHSFAGCSSDEFRNYSRLPCSGTML